MTVEVAGEAVALLPGRGIYWPARRMLIVADVHLGKAAAMRAQGVAIPGGTTRTTLERLTRMLSETGAESLLVLGDLLHARRGRTRETLAQVAAWRERHARLAIRLIRGNHDRRASDPPPGWNIECFDPPVHLPPFALVHDPADRLPGIYTLAGHLHPAFRLSGSGGQSLRLPCFWFGEGCGVLPACGEFTGTARIQPAPGDRIYAIAGGEVLRVPARARRRRAGVET
jgi:DNA ligase-associated metallophosphoesterase